MTILVTGGAGYIGSHTVWNLIAEGHKVVVIDNLSTGVESALSPKASFYKGCISDRGLLKKIHEENKIEAVMHFAAKIEVAESVLDPIKYFKNNFVNSVTLVEFCIEENINQFIFSSTAAVYGSSNTKKVTEEEQIAPINPYGESKVFVEQLLKRVSNRPSVDSQFKYVCLRYFNAAGAKVTGELGQNYPNPTHLIKIACLTALGKRDKLNIFGSDYDTKDGTCIRDYIHVDDLAQAHICALSYLQNGGKSDVFNCGYGVGYTVKEVIKELKIISENDFQVDQAPRRPGDPASLVADNSKIKSILNWKPKYDNLRTICESAYRWEAKQVE